MTIRRKKTLIAVFATTSLYANSIDVNGGVKFSSFS